MRTPSSVVNTVDASAAPITAPVDTKHDLDSLEIEAGVGNKDNDYNQFIERIQQKIRKLQELYKKKFDNLAPNGDFLDPVWAADVAALLVMNKQIKLGQKMIQKLQPNHSDPAESKKRSDPAESKKLLDDVEKFLDDRTLLDKIKSKILPATGKPNGVPDPDPGVTPKPSL